MPKDSMRAARLAKIGMSAHVEATKHRRDSHALIEAIAYMLDAATAKPKPKVKLSLSALPFSPKQVFDYLEQVCSDTIQFHPFDHHSFGRLGKSLVNAGGLEAGDLELVGSWVQSGGLAGWPIQVTWGHVCRHFVSWVAQARAWNMAGGTANCAALGSDAWR